MAFEQACITPSDLLPVIVETSGPVYTMQGNEDIIFCTGAVSLNAISISSAYKAFTVDADGGNVTMTPDGADTFSTPVVTSGSSVKFGPKKSTSTWRTI